MASEGEDVIELGSSDDDVEPAPKRKKSIPNAMVHIPTHLPGVTIKPTTSRGAGFSKRTGLPKVSPKVESVTVTKVPKVVNPLAKINKPNGRIMKKPDEKVITIPNPNLNVKKAPNTKALNPVNLLKKLNSQVVINKVTLNKNTQPIIRINSPGKINSLPPSITVKRGPSLPAPVLPPKQPIKTLRKVIHIKNRALGMQNINKKKPNAVPHSKVSNEVLTVDLDDDDTDASTSSPQWYLKPEDEVKSSLEEENNKEPEQAKYVEITIEDSPVKPKPAKAVEELSFTIEDSPVKPVKDKTGTIDAKSDEEKVDDKSKTPPSKKRLEYPKENQERQVIEIEIEPIVYKESTNVNTMQVTQKDKEVTMGPEIVEIEESPLKEANINVTSTPKKNHSRATVKFPEEKNCDNRSENSEFHPVYQNFIRTCFEIENSEDMQKIVEKKVKTYYRQVPKDYTESEQFIDMVTSKILAMKASPDKMYLFIKDIVDELNLQRKMAKAQPEKTEKDIVVAAESENFLYGENSEFDSKRQRQIRKLEKTLKKLHRAIQKLEEQEVDFDDEEDSVYLLTERYKERMMRVHAKFCQLTNTKMPSEPKVHLEPRPGHPSGPAKRLEKWINKKVPIGTPLPFPDFHDVLRCVKEANEEDKLGWNDVDVMEEARDLFVRCGKKLQRRRQENEWRLAVSRINQDEDPAENNDELSRKLALNKQLASKKEVEVFNKFADKQNQLKLEAEEIGDKEAEESPVESEEEEVVDEESLENKDKRKERLRRLLQEKSKKSTDEKENKPTEKENLQSSEVSNEPIANKDGEIKSAEDDNKKDTEARDKTKEEAPEIVENDPNKKKHDPNSDENRLESDIDELHLLQKLYSENEVNTSTVDSSDSDAPISISDTLDSDSADKKSVISIENSSYSESEINKGDSFETEMEKGALDSKNIETVSIPSTIVKETIDTGIEIECSESGVQKKHVQSNNDEYNESVEDILLASSDDETAADGAPGIEENVVSSDSPGSIEQTGVVENPGSIEGTVNLGDDNLSIGETVVGDKDLVQPAQNSPPLDDKGSDQTGSNSNMEVVNDVSETVISSDADTPMQTDDIADAKEGNDGITHKVTVSNDKLHLNVEVVSERMSVDDDSSAFEKGKDNIDNCGNDSMSPNCDKASLGHSKSGENTDGKKVSTISNCSSQGDNNENDTSSDKIEKVDESMIVDDDFGSNLPSESSQTNVDEILKESNLNEGLST